MQNHQNSHQRQGRIKCVVWDLDNTLWDGTLLESNSVGIKGKVVEIMKTLDGRGILQSIASKNDHTYAMTKLKEFGLHEYFIYPQINWNSKVYSIKKIAQLINIGLDAIAFIDDEMFELEEVCFSLPSVLCIPVSDMDRLLDMPEMTPRFITAESKMRRHTYLAEVERKKSEEGFVGPTEAFLATLNMVFKIAKATADDLQRAEELTVRTHQLNTTGYTYSYEDLDRFRQSDRHKLFVASLEDKFGPYGKIGLALVETSEEAWMIKLLLMSCRVLSRGVGSVMLSYLMRSAKEANVRLLAEFVPNDRNRMMLISYKFAGFYEREKRGNLILFENDLQRIQPFPQYIELQLSD